MIDVGELGEGSDHPTIHASTRRWLSIRGAVTEVVEYGDSSRRWSSTGVVEGWLRWVLYGGVVLHTGEDRSEASV